MDPQLVGWVALLGMLGLLALGVPVYASMAVAGLLGYWMIAGPGPAVAIVGLVPYARLAIYAFTVIPLFILMGNLVFASGYGGEVYTAARRWVGRFPGGLAQATVAACALFGAASGSSVATAATFARLSVPEMLRFGYARRLALASVAAAGTIAQMIPPSIIMVIYGILTEQSISRLLIAGIIPGVIAAANYMILIYFWAKRFPKDAPPYKEPWSWKESIFALKGIWPIVILGGAVMGGIYGGIFTPTEAGAVGAFAALALAVVTRRLSWPAFGESLRETIKTTVMIHLILLGAFIFGHFLAITLIPQQVASFLTGLPLPAILVLTGIMVMYIILGCFMDIVSALFLTIPIIFPAILDLGYDPIWFGVLVVHLVEMAMITPPFGLNLFVIKGSIDGVTIGEIIRGITPFIVADVVTLAIYIAFPQVALFLPNQMLGS